MHKRILFFSLLVLTSLSGYSQFAKGTYTLGGTVEFSRNSTNPTTSQPKYTNTTYSINPEFGIFILPDFQLGAGVYFSHSKSSGDNFFFPGYKSTSYGGTLLARYYYKYFFLEGRYNLSATRGKPNDVANITKYRRDYFQIGVGRAFMISKEVAIEPKVFYQVLAYDSNGDINNHSLNFALAIRVYINNKLKEE